MHRAQFITLERGDAKCYNKYSRATSNFQRPNVRKWYARHRPGADAHALSSSSRPFSVVKLVSLHRKFIQNGCHVHNKGTIHTQRKWCATIAAQAQCDIWANSWSLLSIWCIHMVYAGIAPVIIIMKRTYWINYVPFRIAITHSHTRSESMQNRVVVWMVYAFPLRNQYFRVLRFAFTMGNYHQKIDAFLLILEVDRNRLEKRKSDDHVQAILRLCESASKKIRRMCARRNKNQQYHYQ